MNKSVLFGLTAILTYSLLYPYAVFAETTSITGVIRDAETGEALPVAHLREEGTRNGTISNDDGEFSMMLTNVPATVVASYIGYTSEKIAVTTDSPRHFEIRLPPSPVILETVVVRPEDEATRIMRKVIEKKRGWWPNLNTTAVEAYTRINLSNDDGIVSISESISDVYWHREHGIKEIIRHKRQTKNTKTSENIAMARSTPNFYDDNIKLIGYDCIGPTHPDALKHYRFRLKEKNHLDDTTVFVIDMIPKNKLQPAFFGTISVLDDEFALIAVDIRPSDVVRLPPPLNRLKLAFKQQYSNFGGEFWLPVDVLANAEFKLKIPGLEFPWIKMKQSTRFGEYMVNEAVPDSIFHAKKGSVTVSVSNTDVSVEATDGSDSTPENSDGSKSPSDVDEGSLPQASEFAKTPALPDTLSVSETAADTTAIATLATNDSADIAVETQDKNKTDTPERKKLLKKQATARKKAVTDSVFSNNPNVVPYSGIEEKAYGEIDSTMTMKKAFKPKGALAKMIEMTDDNDESRNHKKQKDPKPFTRLLKKAGDFTPHARYNRVEAWHYGLAWKRSIYKGLRADARGGWDSGPETPWYGGALTYTWGKNGRWSAGVAGSSGMTPRQNTDMYHPILTSGSMLSGRPDYYDWYRNDNTNLTFSFKGKKRRTASLGLSFEHHKSADVTARWTAFGGQKLQRMNPAVKEGQLRSVNLRLQLGERNPMIALAGENNLLLRVEHSAPLLFDSDFTFSRIALDAEYQMQTFLRRRLFPNTLSVKFSGGTSTGTPPVQRYGSLNGMLGIIAPFGTFRALRDRMLEGEHWCALFAEHDFKTVPFELLRLKPLVTRNIGLTLHGAVGRTWIGSKALGTLPAGFGYYDRPVSEIGVSVNPLFMIMRLDVTKRLDRRGVTVGAWLARYM